MDNRFASLEILGGWILGLLTAWGFNALWTAHHCTHIIGVTFCG